MTLTPVLTAMLTFGRMTHDFSTRRLNALLALVVYAIVFIYCYFKFDSAILAVVYSLTVTAIYLFTGFFNCYYLLPKLYRSHRSVYLVISLILIVAITALRMMIERKLFYDWMGYRYFFNYTREHFSFSFVTIVVAFLVGALMRIALDYVTLLQRDEQRKREQVLAELHLLKSQVQPHFLFNALNNIYYLAYSGSERAAESILRLSDVMRYFVEEAPKERVSLNSELEFIKDYIEVERLRLPMPLMVDWKADSAAAHTIFVPPMLFIPFVENVFKHGVDRTRENHIHLCLSTSQQDLTFTVTNELPNNSPPTSTGTGLINLRKRLHLLYDKRFSMVANVADGKFVAQFTVPLL